jgi:hypothetical protein
MKRRLLILAVAIAGVAFVAATLPPRAISLTPGAADAAHVRGIVHVHSRRSDGTGTVDQIAAAAARAGLKFVVITDHGDAAREPEPPAYHAGVLCVDATEVSSFDGHVLALGLWSAAPYPLGGEARDVIEDIARLGGMSVAAHPVSEKASLGWKDWSVPVDGIEWLNADSEWRDESALSLARAMLAYPWRQSETLAALLDRPSAALRQWDKLTSRRRVVALAAADAHANFGVAPETTTMRDRSAFTMPGYEATFRTFSIALPSLHLTGDAAADARALVREIRDGHLYSSIDALAGPAWLSFTATAGERTARPGDELIANGPVTLHAETNAPAGARVALLANGQEVASANGSSLDFMAPSGRAAYRLEVYLPAGRADGQSIPWLASNAIYVGGFQETSTTPPAPKPVQTLMQYDGGPLAPDRWGVEKNGDSVGDANAVGDASAGTRVLFRYGLGGIAEKSPWVALGMRSGRGLSQFDRVMFTARADGPSRLWVELWMPVATGNAYWRRSVYLDSTEREVTVRFDDMRPVADAAAAPPLDDVQSLMFVVDQTHTRLGGSGRVWLDNIRYAR